MINMVEKQLILSRYGSQSIRSISRDLGINRKTVERYVREYEEALRTDSLDVVEDYLSQKPKYNIGTRRRRVITEAVKAKILWCLQENKLRRANM